MFYCCKMERLWSLYTPDKQCLIKKTGTRGKMHVAWFIWSKTRIKHICTVHWNKWGFTLYRENQYNNRLCALHTLCACLISTTLLHCYDEDTAAKLHIMISRTPFFLFKLQSQASHLGFSLKSGVLSTKTTVQKKLMLKESSWDTYPPP